MEKPKKVELKTTIHRNLKFLNIDGETYFMDVGKIKNARSKNKAQSTIVFRKYDVKKYEQLIDDLANKISKKTDVKEIITQGLFSIPLRGILLIEKEMKKEKPKIRNNKGCFSVSVGGVEIPIRD